MARLGGLATGSRPARAVAGARSPVEPGHRYRTLTPIDGRRDGQNMTAAELLPVVSQAFALAGLGPAALVVTGLPAFPVIDPAGQLVAELWHDPHRPVWRATRYRDGVPLVRVAGPLGDLAERIAGWVAAGQTEPRPVRPHDERRDDRSGDDQSGDDGQRSSSPSPADPPPAASDAADERPTFLVTSPTYSLVAELWPDPHQPHWHAVRHQDGRTQETATGTLGRLAERIAQWAPLRNLREGTDTHERGR